jgi:hypothetical protein
LFGLFFDPDEGDIFLRNVGLFSNLHGITTQMNVIFTLTAVITSNARKCQEQVFYVLQGDSSREKEIAEKYKEEKNEPEETRYEKRYKRKIASKCEGEHFSILH